MDYTAILFAALTAAFWLKGAKIEDQSPIIWVGRSIAVSVVAVVVFHGGWLAIVIGQLLLMVAVTVYRTLTDKPPE